MKLPFFASLVLYIVYISPFGIALDQTIPYCVDFYGACATPYPLIVIGMRPELSSTARVHQSALSHWITSLNAQNIRIKYIIEAGVADYIHSKVPADTLHICGTPTAEDRLRATIFYRMINHIAAYPHQLNRPILSGPDLILAPELSEKTGARTLTELIYQTYIDTHSLKSIIALQYLLEEPLITRSRKEIYDVLKNSVTHTVICIKSVHVPLLLEQLAALEYHFFYTSRMVKNRDHTALDSITLTTLLMSSFLPADRIHEQSYLLESYLQ